MLSWIVAGENQRKVRTPLGAVRANAPPSWGEEQWNRENVQGIDPFFGNGRSKGSCWSENSQTLQGARSNRGAFKCGPRVPPGQIAWGLKRL